MFLDIAEIGDDIFGLEDRARSTSRKESSPACSRRGDSSPAREQPPPTIVLHIPTVAVEKPNSPEPATSVKETSPRSRRLLADEEVSAKKEIKQVEIRAVTTKAEIKAAETKAAETKVETKVETKKPEIKGAAKMAAKPAEITAPEKEDEEEPPKKTSKRAKYDDDDIHMDEDYGSKAKRKINNIIKSFFQR